MSNVSLKEQLEAVAAQLSESLADGRTKIQKGKATLSKKAKQNKPKLLDYVQYGVELLKAYFPNCFKSMKEVKPLKKGIKQDLIKQLSMMNDIVIEDKACMVKSLSYYVNTINYHKGVVEGALRIDLQGQPSGIVSAEEAQYSYERYQSRIQKRSASEVSKYEDTVS